MRPPDLIRGMVEGAVAESDRSTKAAKFLFAHIDTQ